MIHDEKTTELEFPPKPLVQKLPAPASSSSIPAAVGSPVPPKVTNLLDAPWTLRLLLVAGAVLLSLLLL